MKRALIIRHVPHEGVAGYREPIEAAGYHVDRVDVGDPAFGTLDLREPDLLIMMGGPMGVYEQERYPWITCQLRRLAVTGEPVYELANAFGMGRAIGCPRLSPQK